MKAVASSEDEPADDPAQQVLLRFKSNGRYRFEKKFIQVPGELNAWEQRKAKELCSINTGKSNTQDQIENGKYPFFIRSDMPVRSNKYLYDCEAVITIVHMIDKTASFF